MEKELRWEKQWIPEHLSAVGNEPWDTVWDRLTDGFRPETVPAGTVSISRRPAREVIFRKQGRSGWSASTAAGKAGALPCSLRGFPWERTSACSAAAGIPGRRSHCVSDFPHPGGGVQTAGRGLSRPGTEAVPDLRPEEPGAWPHADPRQLSKRAGACHSVPALRVRAIRYRGGGGVRLTIRLTHQEVADFLGISGWWCPSAFKA